VLLAPLPDERWITFVGELDDREAERVGSATPREAVAAAIARRVAADIAVVDVGWAAPFRMHHRVVSRLAQDRRFLLGDAGHLSSPLGGEGLNSGLHDAHDLAWKLAL
jgi:6-methylpretetramide 4-monooxygenase / 4-hydroxy-6-methylpretetramide 12a-monooxygenase